MDDRERIFDFIEQDDPRTAIAVDERIATQVLVLLQFPEGGRPGAPKGRANWSFAARRTSWPMGLERIAFASCEFFTARSCGPAN
jgi:toxin ParE1/3/4